MTLIRLNPSEIYANNLRLIGEELFILIVIFNPVDIDECMDDTWPCHANANCHNNIGRFTCTCKDGFMINGANCDGQYFIVSILIYIRLVLQSHCAVTTIIVKVC